MQFPSYFGLQHSKPVACYHGRPASADAIVIRLQDICRTRPGGNRMSIRENARLPYQDGHG
jgi:hypothetical protein